jgi:hypothetical protein
MKLYIKQKVFTFGDKFSVYDENGDERYYVEGEVFTFGKKLHLYSLGGRELAYIEKKLLTFLPIVTLSSAVQAPKAELLILVTLSGMVTVVREGALANANVPIVSTLPSSGITLVENPRTSRLSGMLTRQLPLTT